MDEKTIKVIFAMFVISVVAAMQGVAWYIGFNGTVFAFTSLIIGTVAGTILGFSVTKKAGK